MRNYLLDFTKKFGSISGNVDDNMYNYINERWNLFATYHTMNSENFVIIEDKFYKFKDEYFKEYQLYINDSNIQQFYDEFVNRSEGLYFYSVFEEFFTLGIIVDEEYLFYLKIKHPEILENTTIQEI